MLKSLLYKYILFNADPHSTHLWWLVQSYVEIIYNFNGCSVHVIHFERIDFSIDLLLWYTICSLTRSLDLCISACTKQNISDEPTQNFDKIYWYLVKAHKIYQIGLWFWFSKKIEILSSLHSETLHFHINIGA